MPLRADLLQAIPGESKCGVPLRYSPLYDEINEARREDADLPLGDWQRTLKVADYDLVIRLASDALATKTKDLQLAVWLTEAHVRRDEGFAIVPDCLKFLHDLTDQFWDGLFPAIEDGDLELRAGPLEWIGRQFDQWLRNLAITSDKLSWFKYRESRLVGYESEATTEVKLNLRKERLAEGKLSAEAFDASVDRTPLAFYQKLRDLLNDSLDQLSRLTALCNSRFGSDAPSFLKTRLSLEEIGQTIHIIIKKKGGDNSSAKVVEHAPPEQTEPSNESEEPGTTSRVESEAVDQPQALISARMDPSDTTRSLVAVARLLRQQDPYSVAPYLVLRGFRWGEIRYNGPNVDLNLLEPPSAELRSTLKRFAVEEDWDNVLAMTESAMEQPCGRGWLDPQRYAVRALEGKGESFTFIAQAIRSGVRGLLEDLPGLLDATMLDDTPTANPETLAWIQTQIFRPPLASASAQAPEPAAQATVVEQAVTFTAEPPSMGPALNSDDPIFEAALFKARSGHVHEAIQIVSKELAAERAGRDRFKRRMQLAYLLMTSGRTKIAYPILKQLAVEIDARRLEEWESGEMLAYPLDLLLECASAENEDPLVRATIYSRICQLDPMRGLKYGD